MDDDAVVRSRLGPYLLVFDDLDFVGEVFSGEEALLFCEEMSTDVVLMDRVMRSMEGTAAMQRIRDRCPETQVIALISSEEQELLLVASKAGAIGYLPKHISVDELTRAICAAHAGKPTLASEDKHALAQASRSRHPVGNDLSEGNLMTSHCWLKAFQNLLLRKYGFLTNQRSYFRSAPF